LNSHTDGKRGLDAFNAAVDALEQFLLDHSAYMRGGYLIWYESVGGNNEVRAGLQANHETYRQETRHWIEDGQRLGQIRSDIDAEQFAVLYCSVVFGTIFQWLAAPDSIDLEKLFAHWRAQSALMLS
ncbi:MAG: TetR family transcriptional regulator C-terminal domain-containing protein, partial [Pseudomonadales bacterium]